jgi:gluconolactonase
MALTALACATSSSGGNTTSGASPLPGTGAPRALPSNVPFVSLEGPFWASGGRYLLFSDVVEANASGARIYRFDPASQALSTLAYPGDAPTSTNGLAIDNQGRLIACERYNGRVVRLDAASAVTVLAERWPTGKDGLPLSAPNDLVVRGDGNIFFTDSDWGTAPGSHPPMGVYRISPQGNLSRVLDLDKPNGIALSPDERTLYVGSDVQAKVWKIPLSETGDAGAPALFIDGATVPGGFKVPDGICIDDYGHLYVTNNDDTVKAIVVFDPDGRALGRIAVPARPSNCTFGGSDRRTLYVTTLKAVYAIPVPTAGRP